MVDEGELWSWNVKMYITGLFATLLKAGIQLNMRSARVGTAAAIIDIFGSYGCDIKSLFKINGYMLKYDNSGVIKHFTLLTTIDMNIE